MKNELSYEKRSAILLMLMTLASCSATARPRLEATAPLAPAGAPTAERILDTGRTVTNEAIDYPTSAASQVTAQVVTIQPGQSTGWHRHGVPTFGYVLSGELEVEYASIGRRTLRKGDRLMEAMRTAHNAVNLGTEPVRILAVFMGAQGKQTVMKADPPPMPAALAARRTSELVELAHVAPRVRIDLRYASENNFTGKVVYPTARALMQRPAAEALRRAEEGARKEGLGLLVLDAYRPWSVTRMFWDSFPMHRAYLADPLEGSRHNRGCAVDLTLFDLKTGREIEMPSAYDDFSERAHPGYAGGTASERASRDKLRAIMEAEGFTVYENEWWHFDYAGWREYPVLDVSFDSVPSSKLRPSEAISAPQP